MAEKLTKCEHGKKVNWNYDGCEDCQENFRNKLKSVNIDQGWMPNRK